MVKDIFGTPIKVGNFILLSKGNRGHRDFDMGIVRSIAISPKQIWIKAVEGYRQYNYPTRTYSNTVSLRESRHLAYDGNNKNIIVVMDIQDREEVGFLLNDAVKLLISSGEFPANYQLGDSVEVKEEEKELEVEVSKTKEYDELDLFCGLGMPSSLKKD